MNINSKVSALALINNFESIAQWDEVGKKHFIVFEDKSTLETVTLMKYGTGELTTNRKKGDWYENGETSITLEACASLLWDNRKSINISIKEKSSI